jgi:hypothetical protein
VFFLLLLLRLIHRRRRKKAIKKWHWLCMRKIFFWLYLLVCMMWHSTYLVYSLIVIVILSDRHWRQDNTYVFSLGCLFSPVLDYLFDIRHNITRPNKRPFYYMWREIALIAFIVKFMLTFNVSFFTRIRGEQKKTNGLVIFILSFKVWTINITFIISPIKILEIPSVSIDQLKLQ